MADWLNNIGCYQCFNRYPLHKQCLGWIEDDIIREVDGEDKDDSDWVTDNNSVMSDDGESD